MNNSHVAFNAGEDMEEHFHTGDDGEHVTPHPDHLLVVSEGTTTADDGRSDANQLHADHVVGEDIYGIHWLSAALFPPTLEPKGEDKDGEREEEKDVGDGEDSEDGGTGCGVKAAANDGRVGGVGGVGGVGIHFQEPEEERRRKKGWGIKTTMKTE